MVLVCVVVGCLFFVLELSVIFLHSISVWHLFRISSSWPTMSRAHSAMQEKKDKYSTESFLFDLQHLPPYGTSGAVPFRRLTCVLSAWPSFRICCFTWKNFSNKLATFHLVFADRKATARTTTPWAMQHPDKKNAGQERSAKKFFFEPCCARHDNCGSQVSVQK